ncbi:MAG TPA: tetratricopeptide repeat protein [bacterium]|nr:tetratricopeptide repeat protein [bacterium]
MTEENPTAAVKRTQIIDPTPARRKRLTELLLAYLDDKVSLAELKGLSREQLYQLSEAGFVKFKHGRLDEAEKIYQGLIVLDHRNPYFHAMMGAIHQRRERPIEAILEYSQALKLDRKDVSAYVNRGEIYLRHKNYKKAAQDFRNAILLDMSGANLWANRARSLVIAIKRSIEADKRPPRR